MVLTVLAGGPSLEGCVARWQVAPTERWTYLIGGGLSRGTLLNSVTDDVGVATEGRGVVFTSGCSRLLLVDSSFQLAS